MVGFSDTDDFPAAKCRPVTAHGLRIIPPNQTSSVILKRTFAACAGTSVTVHDGAAGQLTPQVFDSGVARGRRPPHPTVGRLE